MLNPSNYVGRESKDLELLEKSITKLFLNAFDIDLKTCTEGEWTEKISHKGGALKQWKALINAEKLQVVPSTVSCNFPT